MVASVGAASSDARALRGVSIAPSIDHAKNKNTPFTSWMNFFPDLSSNGVLSIGFANCSFTPYFFLTLGCGLLEIITKSEVGQSAVWLLNTLMED